MSKIYAEPMKVDDPSECHWYHTFEFPNHGIIQGDWDLRNRFRDYTGDFDFNEKKVLDVGTASGFLTFEAEKQGAQVVSLDQSTQASHRVLPIRGELWYEDNKEWVRRKEPGLTKVKKSYWFAHTDFQSRANVFYGDLFDLPKELGIFDVGIIGNVLRHLNDPISALGSVARHCPKALIIIDNILNNDEPIAKLSPQGLKLHQADAWWFLSIGAYRDILSMLGYKIEHFSTSTYNFSRRDQQVELGTIIAIEQSK